MKCDRYLLYRKPYLCAFLSTLVVLSFFASSNTFHNQFQVANAQYLQISLLSDNSHDYSKNNISNNIPNNFINSNSNSISSVQNSVFIERIPHHLCYFHCAK